MHIKLLQDCIHLLQKFLECLNIAPCTNQICASKRNDIWFCSLPSTCICIEDMINTQSDYSILHTLVVGSTLPQHALILQNFHLQFHGSFEGLVLFLIPHNDLGAYYHCSSNPVLKNSRSHLEWNKDT